MVSATRNGVLVEDSSVRFRAVDGEWASCPLEELSGLSCEDFLPARKPAFYLKQRNMPGWHWTSTTCSLVFYESLLERAALIELDYDPEVTGIAAQPFELHLSRGMGRPVRHVPDYFVRRRGDGCGVVDVSPSERLDEPRRAESFRLTERACSLLGWSYEVVSEPDPVFFANLQALAGFRRELPLVNEYRPTILAACKTPLPFGELCRGVGVRERICPVVLHLLWRQELAVDLTCPLRDTTLVCLGPEACNVG